MRGFLLEAVLEDLETEESVSEGVLKQKLIESQIAILNLMGAEVPEELLKRYEALTQ